ncbi:hypothetical protein PRZ48_000198 [Zasmidium cellare]|uniref:Uncharacterized protein n=1 Tax=Zasmidium cellare TaxID=395010 RepID=A0ABR0EZD8_ZASCE|nr:hypothetical protein PRZ48_000198 [Zasmidium cellare]
MSLKSTVIAAKTTGCFAVAANRNCQQNCADCIPQFTPGSLITKEEFLEPRVVTDTVARAEARRLADLATSDWHHLRSALLRYGDTVRSRWRKMTKAKREAVILQVQPDLYREKFPEERLRYGVEEPEYYRTAPHHDTLQTHNEPEWFSARQRNALLLPYLNVESMAEEPNLLFGLLHNRSEHTLAEWVSFDAEQLRTGFHHGCLVKQYNTKCVVMHGDRYGELVPWSREACHLWMVLGYPLARVVLEAQTVLLGFLRKIVDFFAASAITPPGDTNWKALTKTGFKAVGEVEFWSVYSKQPFSAPPAFDPYKCLQKATAQLEAAQDHLTFLQTDPAYLQSFMEVRRAKIYSNASPEKVWEEMACSFLLIGAVQDVRVLRLVIDQCEYLVRLHQEHRASLHPFSPLPLRYEVAMAALEHHCNCILQSCCVWIRKTLPTCVGFASHFTSKPDEDGNPRPELKDIKGTFPQIDKQLYEKDSLLWVIMALSVRPWDLSAPHKSTLMSYLDNLLATDPKSGRRIDHPMYALLSKLSLFHSIINEINHHRPRARHFDADSTLTEREEDHFALRNLGKNPRPPSSSESTKVAPLLRKVCETPWPKGKKDQNWLEAATASRHRLSELWAAIRPIVRSMCEDSGPDGKMWPEDIEAEVALVSVDLSADYAAEKEAERLGVLKLIKADNSPVDRSMVQPAWADNDPTEKFEVPAIRTKEKTRPEQPVAGIDVDEAANALADAELRDCHPTVKIEVNANSMNLFTKMFSNGEDGKAKRGKIVWKDVVVAMADAGFAATHCGGSAVSFDPVENAPMQGSIVFHKPHPEPTVDSVMLHIMGKRLHKWFAWDKETFVQREKGES